MATINTDDVTIKSNNFEVKIYSKILLPYCKHFKDLYVSQNNQTYLIDISSQNITNKSIICVFSKLCNDNYIFNCTNNEINNILLLCDFLEFNYTFSNTAKICYQHYKNLSNPNCDCEGCELFKSGKINKIEFEELLNMSKNILKVSFRFLEI
jgi:hypothetical protein